MKYQKKQNLPDHIAPGFAADLVPVQRRLGQQRVEPRGGRATGERAGELPGGLVHPAHELRHEGVGGATFRGVAVEGAGADAAAGCVGSVVGIGAAAFRPDRARYPTDFRDQRGTRGGGDLGTEYAQQIPVRVISMMLLVTLGRGTNTDGGTSPRMRAEPQ